MFVVQGPVDPREGLFVGRNTELTLMEQWLRTSRCVGAVLGARQTGKTSLLLRLQERLGTGYHFAFVNLEAIEGADPDACFAFIAEELREQVVGRAASPPASPVPPAVEKLPQDGPTFLRFLRHLADFIERPRIGVLLDEIGALPESTGLRLAHTLRASFTNRHVQRELGRYQFVIAGSGDLLELTTGRNSPLSNVTESIYLCDLDPPEGRQLLRRGFAEMKSSLTEAVENAILGWTGGHPYWTQLLGTRTAASAAPSAAAVDAVAHSLLDTENRNLPYVRRCLASLPAPATMALDALIGGESLPFNRSDTRVAQLELLGIIRGDFGRAVLRNRIYREALAAWRPSQNATRPSTRPASHVVPISVFVSYAHADESFRIELGKHLSVLERQGIVVTWNDRMILPGSDWVETVDARLEQSHVILLLVSADFIQSRYCYEVEMRRALERHAAGKAIVIPIHIRPVAVQGVPFAHLQGLPKDRKAVTDWPSRDSAYVNIVEGVRLAIAELGIRH